MHAIALSFDAAALLCVAAAFGAAIVLYGTWRTRVLQLYLLFVGSISAFAVALSLETAVDIFSIYDISQATVRVVTGASFVLQAIGGVIHVAVLPHFTYAINNRYPSEAVQRVFFAVSTAMGLLAVVFILKPAVVWTGYLLSGMLFLSIAWCLIRMIPWVRRSTGHAGAFDSGRALRIFLWTSLAFLPLFVADVVVSTVTVPPVIGWFDGTSLPIYLLLLSIGSIAFAKARLSSPALYENDQLTPYCKERFQLTDRETTVVEYVMEGYSVPDLASVLQISAKTAEHHLYSAYQKLSVNNRIQLYNTLMSHR